MKTIVELLRRNDRVSGWKINRIQKESYELFFVKGKLETIRCTDTCDKQVSIYVEHGGFLGDSQFFVYPSTTEAELETMIDEAVAKALLINNQPYTLPDAEEGHYEVQSNFSALAPSDLAAKISLAVFGANKLENGSLNSVEVFINKHYDTVLNSRGLHRSQTRYSAMVEAIPTYNGESQSVELYEQYNFASFDEDALIREISDKMTQVKARYEAMQPKSPLDCKVILNAEELAQLFYNIAGDLNFATVYSHSNLFKKGDAIQSDPKGDKISITMVGEVPGSVRSAKFDGDGLTLGSIRLVEDSKVLSYYGSNRYGQYLGEIPTGELRCLIAEPGTAEDSLFLTGPYLEAVSMSGLQVDFYNDYIGGEIRLAYYHDGEKLMPLTGISISGKLSEVLNDIRFSRRSALHNGYSGPEKALLNHMKIF